MFQEKERKIGKKALMFVLACIVSLCSFPLTSNGANSVGEGTITFAYTYLFQLVDKETQEPLSGGVFELCDQNTEEVIETKTTNLNGLVEFNVTTGDYFLKEKTAPKGYKTVDSFSFEVYDGGMWIEPKSYMQQISEQAIQIENEKIPTAPITITKEDASTGEKLKGGEFQITKTGFDETVTTGDNGKATIDLPAGQYTVTETKAPDGYQLDSTTQTVTLEEHSKTFTFNFSMDREDIKYICQINDLSGDPVEGVSLTVKEKTYTSNETGKITFDAGIDRGDFIDVTGSYNGIAFTPTLSQLPSSFGIAYQDVTVSWVTSDKEELTFTNQKEQKYIATIYKEDSKTGEKLKGAEFEITKGEKSYGKVTTDDDGKAEIELPIGEYTVTETKAPKWYEIDGESKELSIKKINRTIQVTRVDNNIRLKGPTLVFKDADTGEPIEGVEVSVDEDGWVKEKYTTDSNGEVTISSRYDLIVDNCECSFHGTTLTLKSGGVMPYIDITKMMKDNEPQVSLSYNPETISYVEDAEVTFQDIPYEEFTFSKEVVNGKSGDEFEFDVTIEGLANNTEYELPLPGNPNFTILTDSQFGEYTFQTPIKLKDGDEITWKLPHEVMIMVTERANEYVASTKYQADWTDGWVDGDANDEPNEDLHAYISKDAQIVKFINTGDAHDLTVTKNVKGTLGDRTKEFEFTSSFTGLKANATYETTTSQVVTAGVDGTATLTYKLKDDESITVKGLPSSSKVNTTEAKSNHTASLKATKNDQQVTTKENTVKEQALSTGDIEMSDDVDIMFTNTRNLEAVTGIKENRILMIVGALALATLALAAKRKRKNVTGE